MIIKLRDYQKEAVNGLHERMERLLKLPNDKVLVFQAPTGSGKTVMASALLKELISNRNDKLSFSFIWVSVRMLHEQSKEKLESYYEDDRKFKCSYFEDLEDRMIGENEILFINWHSINKKGINLIVRENEQDNNLSSVVRNTKEDGRKIILIIDESHHTAGSEKSKELVEIISPKVTLEISATPKLKDVLDDIQRVDLAEVKEEEMIKSEISINPEFLGLKIASKDADELVIEQALKKREELAKLYKKEGSKVNPLVLVQLPDKKGGLIDKKEDVIKILEKNGISEKNHKLAVWLSEDKTENLKDIEKNDNDVEVLIFKQAPALGWDCPRASILVIFREYKSFEFTIQTIGRIMRMPELEYYSNGELNKGYVFTNLGSIELAEDYVRDYVTEYEAKRDNKLYKNISLSSVYLKRQRERTRLSGEFVKIFSKITEVKKLKKDVDLKPSKIVNPIMSDGKITDIDKSGEIESKGKIEIKLSEKELQDRFDRFIVQNCMPYAPADSSGILKTALYQFFNQELGFEKYDSEVQQIILGKENVQLFTDIVNLAKEKFKKDVVQKLSKKRERVEVPKWEVPLITSYNSRYEPINYPLSVTKPFYTANQSEPERAFVELLNASGKVKWWYKNGESEVKYFAIERADNQAFYPDFIIQFKDGRIGIFETKSGFTAGEDAKERAESLQKYIKANKKKNLIGGIAIYKNGTWRYNDNDKYEYDPDDLSNWKVLNL